MKISRVAIAGASGYSGQELVRILARHRHFKCDKFIGREENLSELKGKVDLAFLCTPAETSLEMAPKLLKLGIHVVDVSGAFRLKKFSYSEWYGFEHSAPQALAAAEYGLFPWKELEIAGSDARLVANPGCFSTAVLMGIIPMIKSGLIRPESLVIDAKSGTTGAGRKAEVKLLFSEIANEFAPYRVGKHQHWPEIVEAAKTHAGIDINPLFITELLPLPRGISAAIFADWARPGLKASDLCESIQRAYATESDISVGLEASFSSMKAVVNTNRVHLQVAEAFGRPVVFVVIDNLLRGAAGQALMNANLLAGIPVQEGLA